MKTITLFRHGLAVELGERGATEDSARMLSAEGVKRTTRAVRGLSSLGCRPERIVSSPLVRAAETAAIAARKLLEDRDVEFSDLLKPGGSIRQLAAWLGKQRETSLMLVGHNPGLEILASYLLTGRLRPLLRLKKAGACSLQLGGDGRATLQWLHTASQLRKLGN